MARTIDPILHVYRADESYFEWKRKYKLSYLRRVFRQRLEKCPRCSLPYEIFPGLILQDEEGNLLTPELQVVLVPYKPEE